MDAEERFEFWLDSAEYDLESAEAMFETGRWVYVVFMCQQAIEKLLKGLYILYSEDEPPRTHKLSRLIDFYSEKLPEDIDEDRYALFDRLSAFYISGRYTEYKDKMSQSADIEEAKDLLDKTKETFAWLLTLKR